MNWYQEYKLAQIWKVDTQGGIEELMGAFYELEYKYSMLRDKPFKGMPRRSISQRPVSPQPEKNHTQRQGTAVVSRQSLSLPRSCEDGLFSARLSAVGRYDLGGACGLVDQQAHKTAL